MEDENEEGDDGKAEVNEVEDEIELYDWLNLDGYGDDDYDDMGGNTTVEERMERMFESDQSKTEENKDSKSKEPKSNETRSDPQSKSVQVDQQEMVVSQVVSMVVSQVVVQPVVTTQAEQTLQSDSIEVRMGSSNRLIDESIIDELMRCEGKGKWIAMDRKEMKAIAIQSLDAKKSKAVYEELLKNVAFED